jgi:hypothetical protein
MSKGQLKKEGIREIDKKVFGCNTKRGSQKLLGHPLTSKTSHGEHPRPPRTIKWKK